MLSEDDPREDVADIIRYRYDAQGSLTQRTSPTGESKVARME